jgi:hypothetical protein
MTYSFPKAESGANGNSSTYELQCKSETGNSAKNELTMGSKLLAVKLIIFFSILPMSENNTFGHWQYNQDSSLIVFDIRLFSKAGAWSTQCCFNGCFIKTLTDS